METNVSGEPRVALGIPKIIAPGPLIAFGTLVPGLLLDQLCPIDTPIGLDRTLRVILVIVLGIVGIWYVWRANLAFRQARTDYLPWKPSRALANADIYAHSRNPMYQGFVLLALAFAVLTRSTWTMLLLVPAGLLIHYGVVLREESYLEDRFGQNYRTYKAQVPRYGLPFASTRRAACLLGAGVAILLGAFAWAIQSRPIAWTIEPQKLEATRGHYAWIIPRPILAPLTIIPADRPADPRRSELQLFEDGRALGPAHAFTPGDDREIHRLGEYAHWRLRVHFATPDGSDPRINGRVYEVRAMMRPNTPVAAGFAALLLMGTVLVSWLMLRRAARQRKQGER